MRNRPGISWGYDAHVNLIRSSKGFLAVFYDSPCSPGEIIKIYRPKNRVEEHKMMKDLAYFNYNTCILCPMVKADIDATC